MLIKEIFETRIEEKIEPVIKVGERQDEHKLAAEIGSYVITPTIERFLDDFLEHYTDTIYNETTEIGSWISGYFGSGKSYLAKIAAIIVENRKLEGIESTKRFTSRVPPDAPSRDSIIRSLSRVTHCDTQVLAFNLNTLADSKSSPLPRLLLSQYYLSKGYGSNFIYARVIEAELDKRGKLAELHAAAERLAKRPWSEMQKNLVFYAKPLYQATCEVAPEVFSSPEEVVQALKNAEKGELYNVKFFVQTVLDDLAARQKTIAKPCRMLLVLDESGQWIEDDSEKLAHLQALVEEAASEGQGKIWIFVTTHADMGAIYANARALKADMKKMEGRFRFKWNLTTENIELVLEDRIFKKKLAGKNAVMQVYNDNPGVLRDLGQLANTSQKLPECSEERFVTFYPFIPYVIHLIPEIVKSLRSAGGRGEQLSGSTRTLLAITQDIIRSGRRKYLDAAVGELVSFDEVYHNLAGEGEVNPNVRRELSRIETVVPDASDLTRHVAEVLYLIGEISYIPRTIDNLARLMVEHTTEDLTTIINRIEPELKKLVTAKMVAKIGEEYEFLTGERRTFEEEVSIESTEFKWQDLEKGLETLAHSENVLGFETIPYKGKEFQARLLFDGTLVKKEGYTDIQIFSPMSAKNISTLEDESLRPDEQLSVFVLCDRIPFFTDHLKYYLAVKNVIQRWRGDSANQEKSNFAVERENKDLVKLKRKVLDDIRDGLKRSQIVFRGSTRAVTVKNGQAVGEVVRTELAKFWPTIYHKYDKVPVRINNEQHAIIDILKGNKQLSADVRELKLFDKAGQLDGKSPLLDAIRIYFTLRQNKKIRTLGKDIVTDFARPPYGWDLGAVRVGVAALVRSGAVRVQINKKPFTNPADPELQDALRVTRNFDKVELILEETEVDTDILTEVRSILIKLTGRRKIDETPAALAAEMETFGKNILDRIYKVNLWAEPAGLPLPADFIEGQESYENILALTNPVHRVNEIYSRKDKLEGYTATINSVIAFMEKWGKSFIVLRDFAAGLKSVEHRIKAGGQCDLFLDNWNTAIGSYSVTDIDTWKNLQNTHAAAILELENLLAAWRDKARQLVQDSLKRLPQDIEAVGLPPEELEGSLAESLKNFLAGLDLQLNVARVAALPERAGQLILELNNAIRRELEKRMKKDVITGVPPKPLKRVNLADIATSARIQNEVQWNMIRDRLDEKVKKALKDGNEVEIGW